MNSISPIPAILATLIAILTSFCISRKSGSLVPATRVSSIDGVRGYLAFFVFLHHSAIWFFYYQNGIWKVPPSNLYVHLGQSSVALFFMITSFLFFSKLIEGRSIPIDWKKLYISRFFRLVPLYLTVMIVLFLFVTILSHGEIHEPLPKLFDKLWRWLGFTILGAPPLNGVAITSRITSGVTWSLPYELFFYFTLPVLALTVRVVPPLPYIILGIVGMIWLIHWNPQIEFILPFLGGIGAAFLVRKRRFREIASHWGSSITILILAVVLITFYSSAYTISPLIILSIIFALIAGGNSLFGLFTSNTSRTLGDMAYSIYLIHGPILFVTFYGIQKLFETQFQAHVHWIITILLVPVIILISHSTFRLIEHRSIQFGKRFHSNRQSVPKHGASTP